MSVWQKILEFFEVETDEKNDTSQNSNPIEKIDEQGNDVSRKETEMGYRISLTINGKSDSGEVDPRELLVDLIREKLGLTGTNVGCDTSSCGACTVMVDGKAVKSCTMFAVQADGSEITTIEGLATNGELHPLQQAFWDEHGLQCGYCTTGMIMASVGLLDQNPNPSESEIRHCLEGNFCRCTGYQNIVKAVQSASQTMEGGA